jgi:hypothetical protein
LDRVVALLFITQLMKAPAMVEAPTPSSGHSAEANYNIWGSGASGDLLFSDRIDTRSTLNYNPLIGKFVAYFVVG